MTIQANLKVFSSLEAACFAPLGDLILFGLKRK
jgi:hypothetical protein